MAAQTAFPDADARRMAGRPAHPFHDDSSSVTRLTTTAGSWPRAITALRPGRDRKLLRLDCSRRDQGAAEGFSKRATVFGCRPQGRLHHQSRQRPRHRGHGGRAGASPSLPRQPLCRGAGRPGTNSTSSTARSIGDVRLKVVKRIVRCAAVNVDPDTAQRDLAIPPRCSASSAAECGIYAGDQGGTISAGDTIAAEQPGCCSSTRGPIRVIASRVARMERSAIRIRRLRHRPGFRRAPIRATRFPRSAVIEMHVQRSRGATLRPSCWAFLSPRGGQNAGVARTRGLV